MFILMVVSMLTATPTRSLAIQSDGSIQNAVPQLYRVKHDAELGPLWRSNVPEVFPLMPEDATPFTKEWQLLSFALNPGMTGDHWRAVYGDTTAFCNGTGFNGAIPRADFVNNRDLTAPLPRLDKPRACGGAILTGVEDGTDLIVKTLDGNSPPPPLAEILLRPWLYFAATTVKSDGSIGRFPQGNGATVWVPLVASTQVTIPLSNLEKLPVNAWPNLPDPYTIYLPFNKSQLRSLADGATYERRVLSDPRPTEAHIVTVDLRKVKRVLVTPKPSTATKPSQYAAQYNPLFLINGDEHTYPNGGTIPVVKGRAMSDGNSYSTSNDEVSLNFGKSSFDTQRGIEYGFFNYAYNVISGSHLLLKDYIIPTGLDNIMLDPRTLVGYNGFMAWFIILEGRLPNNLGLSIKEAAQFMAIMGARDAIMLDGGQDSVLWIRGLGVVNQTPNGEQAIANCLAVWL